MIKICDGWYMDKPKDGNSIELYEWDGTYTEDKHGRQRKANCRERYYSDLKGLYEGLIRNMVKKNIGEVNTIKELVDRIDEIQNTISRS